jgi:hypothetical protein
VIVFVCVFDYVKHGIQFLTLAELKKQAQRQRFSDKTCPLGFVIKPQVFPNPVCIRKFQLAGARSVYIVGKLSCAVFRRGNL